MGILFLIICCLSCAFGAQSRKSETKEAYTYSNYPTQTPYYDNSSNLSNYGGYT